MRSFPKLAIFAALALAPSLGQAKSLQWIGLGLGTDVGYQQTAGYQTAPSSGVVTELNLRVDFLYVFGVELGYNMGEIREQDSHEGLVFDARYRLSGLVYIVPTPYASMYLKGGIGGQTAGELFSVSSPGNSYHAGLGLEFYLTGNIAVGMEFLLLLPGSNSVGRILTDTERQLRDSLGQTYASLKPQDRQRLEIIEPTVGDFISLENFVAKAGLKLYF